VFAIGVGCRWHVGANLHKSGTAAIGPCFTVESDPKLEVDVEDEVLLEVGEVGRRRTREALCGGGSDAGEAVRDEEDGVRARLASVEAIKYRMQFKSPGLKVAMWEGGS
jgi:hypothetical protein